MEYHESPPPPWDTSPFLEEEKNRHERRKKKALERKKKKGKRMKPITITEEEEREINIRLKNGGFLHKEAYAIMEYHCEKCHKSEFIWNSRDGVTPFCIGCFYCDGEMRHINWGGDKREVWHIPKKGERIFITMPNEINDLYARKRIEMYWEHEQYPMRERFANKEEAFKALSGDMQKEGEPFIITWGV